ncbi:MAG: hypothetical protein CBB97_06945 [Candidatus Endolissoclinum sp. TMED37]|nr:MAG: hypothetical protein CBB97_06945 [Candidatus Endolissoclinum sp. TMED37]|tara:strand:+ start:179 stop:439 length:261 start_codon:yes stop_codon:yes gene_type:complete
MNLAVTNTLEGALNVGHPVFVTYRENNKEIVEWFAFGEGLAKGSAEMRNAKEGPDTYNYTSWQKYVIIRDNYNKHLMQLEEIERRL